MRTTVTLDPDVVQLLQVTMRERGLSFKEALNLAIRQSLGRSTASDFSPFIVEALPMGKPRLELTKALQVASQLEDEEIVRKLSARK